MASENFVKSKLSLVEHEAHLKEAVSSLVNVVTGSVTIISSDEKQISTSRLLLTLFSPSLEVLLSSFPICMSPTILLPDCSAYAINQLLTILNCGDVKIKPDDVENVLNVAGVLGVQGFHQRSLTASKKPTQEVAKGKGLNGPVETSPLTSCTECGKPFKNKLVLRRHVLQHHKAKSDLLDCELCDFKTVDSYIFNLHLKRHDNEVEGECDNLLDVNKHQKDFSNLHPSRTVKFDSGLLEDKTVVAFKCKASGCSQAFPVRFKQSRQSPEFILKRLKLHWKLKHGSISSDGFAFDTIYEDVQETMSGFDGKDINDEEKATLEELPASAEDTDNSNKDGVYNDEDILEASNYLFENTVNAVSENPEELSATISSWNDENGENKRSPRHKGNEVIRKHIKLEPNISSIEEEHISKSTTLEAVVYENNEMSENEKRKRELYESLRKQIKQEPSSPKSSKAVSSVKGETTSSEEANETSELVLSLMNSSSTEGDLSDSLIYNSSSNLQIQREQESNDEELNRIAYESEQISEEVQNVLKDLELQSFSSETAAQCYTPSPVKLLPNVLEVIEPNVNDEGASFVDIEDEDMQKKIEDYLKESPISSERCDESSEKHHVCQICSKFISQKETIRHYCHLHFMDELMSSYGDLVNGRSCINCKKNFASKKSAFLHIGRNHGKLNELLCKQGYAPITKNQLKIKSEVKTPNKSTKQEINSSQLKSETKKKLNTQHSKVKKNLSRQLIHKKVLKIDKRIHSGKQQSPLPETGFMKHICQICSKVMQRDDSFTWMHYGAHFLKELTENYSHLVEDLKCTLCDKNYGSKYNVYLHIGRSHEKTNEILEKKGLVPLMPLLQRKTRKKKFLKPINPEGGLGELKRLKSFRSMFKSDKNSYDLDKNSELNPEEGVGELKRLRSFRNMFKLDKNSYDLDKNSELRKSKNQIEPIINGSNIKKNEETGFHCQVPHCKIILKSQHDLPSHHHKLHVDIPDDQMAVKNVETGEIIYPMVKDKAGIKPINTFSELKKSFLQRKIQNLKIKLKNRTGNYQPGKDSDSLPTGNITSVRSPISQNLNGKHFTGIRENKERVESTENGESIESDGDMTYPTLFYASNGRVVPMLTKKVEVCINRQEIFIHFQDMYLHSQNSAQNCDLKCQLCTELFSDHAFLWQHYFSDHLYTEMYIKFGALVSGNICLLCGRKFFENSESLKHLGKIHGKLNELLVAKRLHPIFVPEKLSRPTSLGSPIKNKAASISMVDMQRDGKNKEQQEDNTENNQMSIKTITRKRISPKERQLQRISEEQKRNFNCDTCLTTLSSQDDAQEHSLLCSNYKFSCSFCGISLQLSDDLENHKKGCKDRINYLYSVHTPKRYSTL